MNEVVKVESQTLNVPSSITKVALFGPKSITALQIPFDVMNNSGGNLNYTFAPSSILTNEWYVRCNLVMQVTAPNGALTPGADFFNSSYGKNFAFRNYPLLWSIQSGTLRLNTTVFTTQLKTLMPYTSKILTNKDALEFADCCPALPDQGFFNYSDSVGTSKNVNAGYNDSRENWIPRGSFQIKSVGTALNNGEPNGTRPVVNGTGGGSGFLMIECTIPLLLQPLANRAIGIPTINLANLYSINLQLVFDGTFQQLLSVPSGWTVSAPSNVFGNAANSNSSLLVVVNYPSSTQPIPKEVRIPNPIFEIKSQSLSEGLPASTGGGLVPGTSVISSATYQYDSYPDCFVFYVQKKLASQTASDSSSFFKLREGFSLTINGDNSLLNGYKDSQVYQICKKYVRMDFQEFMGRCQATLASGAGLSSLVQTSGPVYVLKVAEDIEIGKEGIAPNMAGYRIQLQFNNLVAENWSSTVYNAGDLEFVVIALRTGEVVITESSSSQTSNLFTQAEVVKAMTQEPIYSNEVEVLEGQASGGKKKTLGAMVSKAGARSAGARGGARSAGKLPANVGVPNSNTSRF